MDANRVKKEGKNSNKNNNHTSTNTLTNAKYTDTLRWMTDVVAVSELILLSYEREKDMQNRMPYDRLQRKYHVASLQKDQPRLIIVFACRLMWIFLPTLSTNLTICGQLQILRCEKESEKTRGENKIHSWANELIGRLKQYTHIMQRVCTVLHVWVCKMSLDALVGWSVGRT